MKFPTYSYQNLGYFRALYGKMEGENILLRTNAKSCFYLVEIVNLHAVVVVPGSDLEG